MRDEKSILVTGGFTGDKRILHGKEAYFQRLINYMSKHHGFRFDIKDISCLVDRSSFFKRTTIYRPVIKLLLPPGCTHSYLKEHTGQYFGSPNFKCVFSKKDRNVCLSIARRQYLYISRKKFPIPLSQLRALKFFISAGIALKQITNELIRLSPALIICFNRETPINTLLRIIAKRLSIPILFVEGGILSGTIEFDSVGNDALSWPVRYLAKFNQLVISEEDKSRAIKFLSFLRKNKISRKTQRSGEVDKIIGEINIDRPLIFFAGSNERGTGIYFQESKLFKEYSPFFSGNEDALNFLIELAVKHDWSVIFKPHPNETDGGKFYNVKNPKLHIVKHANIFELIEISDVTITITSGVSGISLIHGKPSILLGKNGLYNKGATYDLDKKENLGALIVKALGEGFTADMQKMLIEYAARTIKYYSFSFGRDIEKYIGRGVEEAAQLLIDYLHEEKRENMRI